MSVILFFIIFWIVGGPSSLDQIPMDYFINREGKNGCCRVCYVGVACGNSCIKRATPCTQPPGCACNRKVPIPPKTTPEEQNQQSVDVE
ncbi:MAG: hypothetical protein KDD61_02225 [Bdellovibrionales bacterium]|nr:hypothetical protein [Bdellovibrionales bacterium]